jgi:predicted TPR repeat methyltransferase/Tfp pilus assembly protein PilF
MDFLDQGADDAALALLAAEGDAGTLGRWKLETPAFVDLLEKSGSPVLALRQFGVMCRGSGDQRRAIAAFLAALSLAPDEVWLWRDLAAAYQQMSRTALAVVCARKALAMDATHAATWLQYAILVDGMGPAERAEHAFLRALALDPGLTDASFGLGLLYLKTFRFEEAAVRLSDIVTRGDADAIVYVSLGNAQYMAARFAESAEAYARASEYAPLEGHSLRKFARARTFAAIIAGNIEQALADYPALAGAEIESLDQITRDGFSLFSAYGYPDAAVAVGEWRLSRDPDDAVQQYLNNAVAGKPIDEVPAAYVETYFDSFAAGFDDKLVGVLGYQVPRDLAGLVAGQRSTFSHMLDLGCGTGLAAEFLVRLGDRLVGVDLSAQMLAQAAKRGTYHALTKCEAVDFLHSQPGAFDLVFAADLLIYFGRLDELIAAVARATVQGGIFAASIESARERDFEVLPSGRFAQAEAYLAALTAPHFEMIEQKPTVLRLEAGAAVKGALFVFQRR